MKYGICLEMVFTSLPLPDRIRKAAEAGFEYGEMWFVDKTYQGDPESLAKTAGECGFTLTGTVIAPPDAAFGGGLTDATRREEWLKRTRMTLDFNRRAGIPNAVVCTGNVIPGMGEEVIRHNVLEGLKPTVEMAEEAGITLLLEPLNTRHDHIGYWLESSDRAADLVRAIDSERFRLLYDCYHMQIMEGDLIDHIQKHIGIIGHFHSAGVPGRHELFHGEVDYRFVIGEISKLGYAGIFGLEYMPAMEDGESLRQTLAYLRGNES